jgi:hypothetical protein
MRQEVSRAARGACQASKPAPPFGEVYLPKRLRQAYFVKHRNESPLRQVDHAKASWTAISMNERIRLAPKMLNHRGYK